MLTWIVERFDTQLTGDKITTFSSKIERFVNLGAIRIAPLRERPEDIPLLVRYLAPKYGRRMQKQTLFPLRL